MTSPARGGAERDGGVAWRDPGAAGDAGPTARAHGSSRERRLVAAGRVTRAFHHVRFAPSTEAPIRGPWTLELLVRSRETLIRSRGDLVRSRGDRPPG